MKIAVIGRGYPHKGTPTYRMPLYAKLIDALGADIILCEREPISKTQQARMPPGFTYVQCTPFPFYAEGIPFRLLRLLKERQYDVVIAMETSSSVSLIAALAKKRYGFKLIVFSELWFYAKTPLARIGKPLVRWVARQADALVLTWEKAKTLHRSLGATQQVFWAPDAANDISRVPLQQKVLKRIAHEINPEKKRVILYMGRFVQYKGLDDLLRAYRLLEEKRDDCVLVVVGEGPFEKACKKLTEELGITRIVYKPWVAFADVPYYYALADAFVLPARFDWSSACPAEAWGMTVHEAMLMQTPVVATTAVASAVATIENKKEGFIVPQRNAQVLCATLNEIVGNKPRIREIGAAARKKVQQHFNYATMARGFIEAVEYVKTK
jgi:glycosyltransferase involved in cell wall biosynthesis